MRYDYVVTLKRSVAGWVDLLGFFICLLSAVAFTMVLLRTTPFTYFLCFAAAVMLGGMMVNSIASKKGRPVSYKYWLFAAGIFWLAMPFLPWLIIPFFLLGFLEPQVKRPLEVGFSEHIIVINSLFKRKIGWQQLNSVILKDGLLTIDFVNNHLFQQEVLDDDEPDADEDEFNAYCRNRLKSK